MNVCSKCGAEMGDNVKFCKECGTKLSGRQSALINEKKARVTAEEKNGLKTIGVVAGVAMAVLSAWVLYSVFRGKPEGPVKTASASSGANAVMAYMTVEKENGEVKIPLADLADGRAHFYTYTAGDKVIKFFALRKADGSIGVALDACSACYRAKKGYRQEGSNVICNNCGMAFRPEDVGIVTGGCNPIPVAHRAAGDIVTVKAADLEKGRIYF
jgi:uncharacterized membrane protein